MGRLKRPPVPAAGMFCKIPEQPIKNELVWYRRPGGPMPRLRIGELQSLVLPNEFLCLLNEANTYWKATKSSMGYSRSKFSLAFGRLIIYSSLGIRKWKYNGLSISKQVKWVNVKRLKESRVRMYCRMTRNIRWKEDRDENRSEMRTEARWKQARDEKRSRMKRVVR